MKRSPASTPSSPANMSERLWRVPAKVMLAQAFSPCSGDEIFVDRNKRAGEGVHVVRVGDALHVKQVQASAPGRIAPISANDAYAPIELAREEVEVIGRVVWKGGRI